RVADLAGIDAGAAGVILRLHDAAPHLGCEARRLVAEALAASREGAGHRAGLRDDDPPEALVVDALLDLRGLARGLAGPLHAFLEALRPFRPEVLRPRGATGEDEQRRHSYDGSNVGPHAVGYRPFGGRS